MSDTPARTTDRGLVARGAIAGVVGATILAIWFLLIDGIAGEPFRTPAFLARVLLGSEAVALEGLQVALYTVIHYGVFIGIGIAVAGLLDRLEVVPGLLLGAVLGFLLFDLLFYGGIWFTGVNVIDFLGWPAALVGNILAGVGVVETISQLRPGGTATWGEILAAHTTVREGLIVGLIGAVAVAAWFLIIDVVAGRLLFTPAALGSVVFHGATGLADVHVDAVTILGYTGLHLAAFGVTGLVAAGIVALAEDRHPYILLGAVLLFVTFETFFIGLVTIVAQWLLEVIPWWSIAVGNLIAAVAMGYYLWKRHPKLVAALGDGDLERRVGMHDDERTVGAPGSATPGAGGSSAAGPDTR